MRAAARPRASAQVAALSGANRFGAERVLVIDDVVLAPHAPWRGPVAAFGIAAEARDSAATLDPIGAEEAVGPSSAGYPSGARVASRGGIEVGPS